MRLPGASYVELPLAPPEIDLDAWRESLRVLRTAVDQHGITHLAPTHFGLYDDVPTHLDRLEQVVDAADDWTRTTLPNHADDPKALRDAATDWMRGLARDAGVDDETWTLYELANPSWMAALGLKRYWSTRIADAE
ncbi:MAG: hypothetical protein R6T83_09545 [Salinibacter sp.]